MECECPSLVFGLAEKASSLLGSSLRHLPTSVFMVECDQGCLPHCVQYENRIRTHPRFTRMRCSVYYLLKEPERATRNHSSQHTSPTTNRFYGTSNLHDVGPEQEPSAQKRHSADPRRK